MEESFPRGGNEPKPEEEKSSGEKSHRKKKRSLDKDDAAEKASEDFLFGAPKRSSSSKRKKHKKGSKEEFGHSANNKHSLLPLGGGGVSFKKNLHKESLGIASKPEPFIEALGFSKLDKGTKLLGIVREVQDDFVVFSLPNLLTGYVLRNETGKDAPPLTESASIGQVMATVIVKTVTETVKNPDKGRNKNKGPVKRRRIQLSIEPSVVNLRHEEPAPRFPIRGKVQAMEDNGIVVDLGHGRKGFLPYDQMDENTFRVKEDDDDDEEEEIEEGDGRIVLKVGRIDDFIVKKGAKGTQDIIPLALPSRDELAKHMVPTDSMPSIQGIAPGWLIKVKVEALARNGLCVTFFGNVFRGAIELSHLGGFWIPTTRQVDGSSEWKSLFRDDSESPIRSFTARVLAVDAATKMVRLTVLPHLMDLSPPPISLLPPMGTVIEDAKVIRLDPGIGALLALPPAKKSAPEKDKNDSGDDLDVDDDDDLQDGVRRPLLHDSLTDNEVYLEATKVRAVYVHISKAMDETEDGKTPEALFAKEFAPSTTHKLRILSTSNYIEGVASGAAAPSVIGAHVLSHADLLPGKTYRNVPVCAHLNGGGVLVDFGMGIRGLITADHLFDQAGTSEFRSKMLKAKYDIDAKVDVRVLKSDPVSKRCLLTAKKSLLQASDVLTSYEDCKLGQTATGFISKVDDQGLAVTFFNNIFGRVTARSLALELGIDDHRENYKVGDAVQTRIVNIKKSRRGRRRSKALDESDDEEESDDENTGRQYFWELILSLRVNIDESKESDQLEANNKTSKKIHLRAGAVLPAKSMKIVSLNPGKVKKDGSYVPGYAIVSIKSQYLVDEAESGTMLPYVECKLPYDNLLDDYHVEDRNSAAALDELAEKLLTVGKKLNRKGILMTDPRKSAFEFSSGLGKLTIVSVRPKMVELCEAQLSSAGKEKKTKKVSIPTPESDLFAGASVLGYVAVIDRRHGAFVRFLGDLTGLLPKTKGGLDLELFSTVVARIDAVDDKFRPPKISLSVISGSKPGEKSIKPQEEGPFKVGDVISSAEIQSIDFFKAKLKITDEKWKMHEAQARIHCTASQCDVFEPKKRIDKVKNTKPKAITKYHPFYKWETGMKLQDLRVVSTKTVRGVHYVDLTNRKVDGEDRAPLAGPIDNKKQAPPGSKVVGIIKQMAPFNKGIILQLGHEFTGFLPALECSTDPEVLNNLSRHFQVGACLECAVIDKSEWLKLSARAGHPLTPEDDLSQTVFLSLLCTSTSECKIQAKPCRGDLVVGRIQRTMKPFIPPALMLELRGGYLGRCCITELNEVDDWVNMPLGHALEGGTDKGEAAVVSGESDMDVEEEDGSENAESNRPSDTQDESFPDNTYVMCRVVAGVPGRPIAEVSLRPSRIEGDLDDDELAEAGDMVPAYVVETNKRGCFVRLSRKADGRVILKELSDDFLPNPAASFPPGRLVVGKIKEVKHQGNKGKKKQRETKTLFDLDMRESTVLESTKLQFSDVELYGKYKATVTRVETYGVFVRLENSNVSGLVHKSECSDKYVKNIFDLYDPGDLVKVLVIKKDEEEKKIGFSMKASHFADDEDSDDESLSEGMSDESDDDGNKPDVVPNGTDEDLDSDDENFATKLAAKMGPTTPQGEEDDATADSSSSNDSESSSSSDSEEDRADDAESDANDAAQKTAKVKPSQGMDTDVGFDWSASSSVLAKKKAFDPDSDNDDEEMEDADGALAASSHKSRKKQAQKRREEQEIFRRETALADGTADENPETAADFERLISGEPNSSELWIRYMAFHLSLADVASARAVAERAFARIEFREEREKLNVWSALLTLELKYGSASSLQKTIDRACQQNNPKQVYLRVCEMLEKEVNASSPDTIVRADEMFAKMCKKFRSKKKVWIFHLQYLLKAGRHKEAHELLSRALKSLPEYKHVETMSKFAQLEFEFGSPERARTVFDGILLKNPKRLDLIFVYADKEIKHGSVEMARSLFERISNPPTCDGAPRSKLTDKQMKSLFKKWYKIEEEHGTPDTQERVKDAAKAYVARTTSS